MQIAILSSNNRTIDDIHNHIDSLYNPQNDEYTDKQLINDYMKSLPIHVCDKSDYQIEVEMDGLLIWDDDRYIGFLKWENSSLDKLILKDNR